MLWLLERQRAFFSKQAWVIKIISIVVISAWKMFESSLVPLNNLQEFQVTCTAQNTFTIKDFFSKRDQIRWKLRIWSHLLRKNLMENIIFWAVMDLRQRRKVMKTFICSQFRYYPLIWMFYSRKMSNTVKSLHKLFLKVISRDYK